MNAHDLLHHLRQHFAAPLGTRATAYLSPSCPDKTAQARAILACAALKAVGAPDAPTYAGDWLASGRQLVEAELHTLSVTACYISEEEATAVRRQLATTLTPVGLLKLLCATWRAGRKASQRYAAARLDGLTIRPEEARAALPDFADLPESYRLTA